MINGEAETRGKWNEAWAGFGRHQAAEVAATANDAEQGADLLSGVAAE